MLWYNTTVQPRGVMVVVEVGRGKWSIWPQLLSSWCTLRGRAQISLLDLSLSPECGGLHVRLTRSRVWSWEETLMPHWIVPIKNSALPAVATPCEIREELQAASTKFSATENTTFMSQVFLQACKKIIIGLKIMSSICKRDNLKVGVCCVVN